MSHARPHLGQPRQDRPLKTDPLSRAAIELQRAVSFHQAGKLTEAEAGYRRVLALDPANHDALGLLGMIHHSHDEHETAIRLLRAAIAIRPAARFYTNLGVCLEAAGDLSGCIAAFRQAVALSPTDPSAWTPAVFNGDLHPYGTPQLQLAARREFNAQHCAALTQAAAPHTNDPDPDRRLRVGYLSADFRHHSAALVLLPILAGHDHQHVEVYCYWQQYQEADAETERFRQAADHWRVVTALSDDELAQQIRRDQIDILVDLSGYSNGNRLTMLARKPAPLIMTGWGHATGLGIDACDYLLADAITAPTEIARHYHESILHLPCILAFDPRPPYPDVAPPPAATTGTVTFGYFGRTNKTSEPVWAIWAQILQRVPQSRLVFKGRDYAVQGHKARLTEFFGSLGVESSRLVFLGATPRPEHLRAYSTVDVALDTWPQSGGVTTLEACLMGVPSVALRGDSLNGRVAASILATLGRPFWIGASSAHYVEIAVLMAKTAATLEDRQSLRTSLLESIICRPAEYTRVVETVYRQAWVRWCQSRAERSLLTLVGAW